MQDNQLPQFRLLARDTGVYLIALFSVLYGTVVGSAQTVDCTWTNPSGGSWHTPANWSPAAVPNNAAGTTYNASIALPGPAYSVALSSAATIDNLTLSSTAATLNHTAGTLKVNGVANLNSGKYRLSGGTIADGVWNVQPGVFSLAPGVTNTFDGADFRSTLDFVTNSPVLVQLRNGATYQGDVTLDSGDQLVFNEYDNLDGHSFHLMGSGAQLLLRDTTQPTFLGAGIVIHGRYGSISGFGGQGFVNAGLISADEQVSGGGQKIRLTGGFISNVGIIEARNRGEIELQGQNTINESNGLIRADPNSIITVGGSDTQFVNRGTIELNQGILNLAAAWSNDGVIHAVNSNITLGSTFTTAQIGVIQRTGGAVKLTGYLDNTNAALHLNATTGSWILAGGYIAGGIVDFADGANLVPAANTTSTFDHVDLRGPLNMSVNATTLRLSNGTTFFGDVVFSTEVNLIFSAGQTISGKEFRHASPNGSTGFLIEGPGEMVLDTDSAIRGGLGYISDSGSATNLCTLRNRGVISADRAGTALEISCIGPLRLTNEGTIEARNGGTLTIIGPVSVSNFSGATITGGHWGVYDGSTLDLSTHKIEINQADILLSGPTSSFQAIEPLQWNRGSFSILDGRNFATTLDLQNDGIVHIGDHSTLTVHGELIQSELASLMFDIGGTIPGGGFGRLLIDEDAQLKGELVITLASGYVPALGDQFRILTSLQRTGSFDSVAVPGLPGNLTFDLAYDSTGLSLVVVPEPASLLAVLAVLVLARRCSNRFPRTVDHWR